VAACVLLPHVTAACQERASQICAGKLPGLCDEDCPSGCVKVTDQSGWSSRVMWRSGTGLESYMYAHVHPGPSLSPCLVCKQPGALQSHSLEHPHVQLIVRGEGNDLTFMTSSQLRQRATSGTIRVRTLIQVAARIGSGETSRSSLAHGRLCTCT
jgi:hypothetical protein